MADAVLAANRFMKDNGAAGTHSQMIVLLADGDNDCGDVARAMDQLRAAGIVFRHETVGFGIAPTSDAVTPRPPLSSPTCSWSSLTRSR